MKISGHIVRSSAVAEHLKRRRAPHDLKSLIKIMKISSFLAVSCLRLRTGLPLILAFPLLLVSAPVSTLSGSDARFTFNATEGFATPATGGWTFTGSLNTARYAHTATLLPNGKVLVACGGLVPAIVLSERGTVRPGQRELECHRQPQHRTRWSHGDVAAQRQGAGGRGISTAAYLASAELYDPASGSWSATGSLNTARYCHTATLLPNGKVLVAGGADGSGSVLASAELYDPASGTWTATGSLNTARVVTHGDVAAQRQGAGGRGISMQRHLRERRTVRPGERELDCHRQPQHRDALSTRRRCCPTARCLLQGDTQWRFSRARNCTIRRAGPGLPRAASTPHALITRRRCCPTARCWWQGD